VSLARLFVRYLPHANHHEFIRPPPCAVILRTLTLHGVKGKGTKDLRLLSGLHAVERTAIIGGFILVPVTAEAGPSRIHRLDERDLF
jgi:hypothetical protein